MEKNVCTVCAPKVAGKIFVVATTSQGRTGPKAVHLCIGGIVTSRIVSWHTSMEAARKAAKAYRRATGARSYTYTVRHPEAWD